MPGSIESTIGRRALLGGLAASAALALPACSSLPAFSLTEAIRRLLLRSSQRAFARLMAPGGFYDDSLTRLDLPPALRSSGNVLTDILTSTVFKKRLVKAFNGIAERGAERAAPLVADAVRTIGIANAKALVEGGPRAASDYLRGAMGMTLVEAMVPELGQAMRVAEDPVVGQALAKLTGIDVGGVARQFAGQVDDAIWGQIGREETAIRADPASTNDPLLIGVFGGL